MSADDEVMGSYYSIYEDPRDGEAEPDRLARWARIYRERQAAAERDGDLQRATLFSKRAEWYGRG